MNIVYIIVFVMKFTVFSKFRLYINPIKNKNRMFN